MTAPSGFLQRWSEGIRFFVLGGSIVSAWVLWLVTGLPGHIFSATRFILYDQGSYLYAVGRWQAGEALYRDFAWQYGPLALGWYRSFAAVGGNTPLTLVLASSLAFAGAWMLMARLVLRAAGPRWGWPLALAGLLPVMALSGPYAFNGPHGAIEMLLLSAVAWVLASEGKGRAWKLGVLAGLLQGVRFGPHVVALVVILSVEASRLWADRQTFRREIAAFAGRLLAAYGVLLVLLAAWFFRALPAVAAREQLWPGHMLAHYAATYPERWPTAPTFSVFMLTWLPALLSFGLAANALISRLLGRGRSAPSQDSAAVAGVIFAPLYYLFGCVLLFRNAYAMTGHLWLIWTGLALLGAGHLRRVPRTVLLLAVIPALGGAVAGAVRAGRDEQTWQAAPFLLPNGQQLWFRTGERENFAHLQAALGTGAQPRRVAVFLAGGGIHHFFGTQRVGRQWWFLPEFVRPWEEQATGDALLRHDAIFVADLGQVNGSGPVNGVVALWLPLPASLNERLLPHLENPRAIPGLGTLVKVRP